MTLQEWIRLERTRTLTCVRLATERVPAIPDKTEAHYYLGRADGEHAMLMRLEKAIKEGAIKEK